MIHEAFQTHAAYHAYHLRIAANVPHLIAALIHNIRHFEVNVPAAVENNHIHLHNVEYENAEV